MTKGRVKHQITVTLYVYIEKASSKQNLPFPDDGITEYDGEEKSEYKNRGVFFS